MEAGEHVHKLADIFKFMEGKSSTFIYYQKTLHLAIQADEEVVWHHEDSDAKSPGNCVRIYNKTIKVNMGSKYDRPVKISANCCKNLKSLLVSTETTNEDVLEMKHILSSSLANKTANNYISVKMTLVMIKNLNSEKKKLFNNI